MKFFSKHRFENDLSAELRFHVEQQVRDFIAAGMSEEEAWRKARIEFGGIDRVKEECRDIRPFVWLEQIWQDVRFAFRFLAKSRLFTAVVIVTLAIGIGANTAIFSIVEAVILRPLPYRTPDRLVVLWGKFNDQPESKVFLSFADFQELQRNSRTLEAVAAETWASSGATLTWRGEPYRVSSFPVSENLFSLLGAAAVQGRTFTPDDSRGGCAVVVSYRFWNNQLGGSPDVLNHTLRMDDRDCAAVGIMPAGFDFYPREADLWTLIAPDSAATRPDGAVAIFGRLKQGVTKEEAQAEAVSIHQTVARNATAGSWVQRVSPTAFPLKEEFTWLAGRNLRQGLLILLASSGMLLLIACVNIAGLLVGRATERQKEIMMRAALGCPRSRIVRQLLAESVLISAAGAVAGTISASWAIHYFRVVNPIELPPASPVTIDVTVLAFAILVAGFTAIVFGLLPAINASQPDMNQTLKATSSRVIRNWWTSRTCKLLLSVQIGLSMTIAVGAGLFMRSMDRLASVPLGFRAEHLLTARLELPKDGYTERFQKINFYDRLIGRLKSVPGLESVALSSEQPLRGQHSSAISISDETGPQSELGDVGSEQVSDDFFVSMNIPLLQGRQFDSRDREGTMQAAIVNQRFVQEYFHDENPIGRQFKFGLRSGNNPWMTIVGVVGNVARIGLKEMGYEIEPLVYRPLRQRSSDSMIVLARVSGDPLEIVSAVRREVKAIDSRVPVYLPETVDQLIAKNLSHPRFRGILLVTFALFAILLAAVGIYGVFTQSVLQRTPEIGLRMAVGAERRHILRLVLKQALVLTTAGIAIGIAGALSLSRFATSMLYETAPNDPRTVFLTSVLLFAVAITATYLPARRATRIDPITVLRND
jgi:putative ABC transport system permease protein